MIKVCVHNPLPLAACEYCRFNPRHVKPFGVIRMRMQYIEPKITNHCSAFELHGDKVNGSA